jgi:hypothetical protein
MPRKFTNQLIDLTEQGLIHETELWKNLLNFLSDSDVEEFFESNYPDWYDEFTGGNEAEDDGDEDYEEGE